jgi:hypothetical protein
MALSADTTVSSGPVSVLQYPVKATTQIYNNALVMLVGGYLLPLADTSAGTFAGVAQANVLGLASDGLINCPVDPPSENHRYLVCPMTSPQATDLGKLAYGSSDCLVATSSSNAVIVGKIVQLISTATAGSVLVDTMNRVA